MYTEKKIISGVALIATILQICVTPFVYATEKSSFNTVLQTMGGNLTNISHLNSSAPSSKNGAISSLKSGNKTSKQKNAFVSGQVLVKFKTNKINLKNKTWTLALQDFSNKKKLRLLKKDTKSNTSLLATDATETTDQAVSRLKSDASIEFVQPNYIYSTSMLPNDTNFGNLWGLNNLGQTLKSVTGTVGVDMDSERSWDIFTGATIGTGSVVAVIDDGVAYNHPDLVNKMWDGTDCRDQNNAVLGVCVHGYDFVNGTKTPLPLYGDSHGTHVAGTIAAEMNNSKGIVGVNPSAKIMALKAWENGGLTTSAVIDAIAFAKNNGAHIINASWGMQGLDDTTPYTNNFDYLLYNAIKDFGDNGGLFIAAAGNNGNDHDIGGSINRFYPSDFSVDTTLSGGLMLTGLTNIISVAATDQNDVLTWFSDYGSGSVQVGAPGENIYSTVVSVGTGFYEDFSTTATGSVAGFTTIGNTVNTWQTSSGLMWADTTRTPYLSGADMAIQKNIPFSDATVTSAQVGFDAWCDTPSSASWKDFVSVEISTGSTFLQIKKFDEDTLFGGSSTVNGFPGWYQSLSIDIPLIYKTPNFILRFRWVSDGIDDTTGSGVYNRGCAIDNILIKTYDDGSANSYAFYNGTSMATPHVSGLASLIWGYKPNLTAQDIKNTILSTGDSVASLVGKTVTGKRINAYRALASTASPTITNLRMFTSSTGSEISENDYTNTVTPYFSWNAPVSVGTMSGYLISVNSASGLVYTGTTSNLSFSGYTFSQDGIYTVSIVGENDMNATGSIVNHTFTLGTVAPTAPTNIVLNNGVFIGSGAQNSVTLFGSGLVSDSGAVIQYSIQETDWSGSVNGSGTLSGSGSFSIFNINVSGLLDGMLDIYVHFTDRFGNTSTVGLGSVMKSAMATNGQVVFLSGASSASFATALRLSSNKTVDYSITGTGLLASVTGSILGSGSTTQVLSFTGGDGLKTVTTTFTDAVLVTTTIDVSILIDTTAPVVTILSHTDNAILTGTIMSITGSISDLSTGSTLTVNGANVTSASGNWSTTLSLSGGDTILIFHATDPLGNSGDTNFHLRRLSISNVLYSDIASLTGANIVFQSDISGTGVVIYGTAVGSLTASMTGSTNEMTHTIPLTNLLPDTTYYYQVYTTASGYDGAISNLQSFHTPHVIDINDGANESLTGTVSFSGATATGVTFSAGSGSVYLQSMNGLSSLSFSLSGLTIASSGSWDQIIQAPEVYTLIGSVSLDAGYAPTGMVYKAGSNATALAFSGQAVLTSIFVGTGSNNKTLRVYRSNDSGATFTNIASCTVTNGNCSFSTDHFSLFTFGEPTDGTPDAFSIPSKTNAELSTETISDTLTISGVNIAVPVSISGGTYSINAGAFTGAPGTLQIGESIRVKLTSSAAYSTPTSLSLTIGGVSATFGVTTKAQPVAPVNSWGGGGGSYTPLKDTCPNGDYSASLYDGACGTKPATSQSGAIILVLSGATSTVDVNPYAGQKFSFASSLLMTKEAAKYIQATLTDPIERKLDAKTKNKPTLRQRYYVALESYLYQRQLHTKMVKEKQVYKYLREVFGKKIVKKMVQ